MAQNPPTGDAEAVLQGNPVSNIPADRAEGVLSLLKFTPYGQQSSMGDLIGQHHQTRLDNARMYSNAAKTALHAQLAIQHGIDPESGLRFDDPSYKGPTAEEQAARYQANYNEAWGNYKKLAGVDQNTKGALAKAEQILNHILGGGAMQSAPGAPSNQGRPGSATPPPVAQGLSGNAGGPSQVEAATTPPASGMKPPPQPDVSANPLAAPMIEANTQFQEGLGRKRQATTSDVQTRQGLVKQVIPQEDWNKPYVQDYVLTGNMTRGMMAHLQKSNMVDPETGEPVIFDPMSGEYATQDGRQVKNPVPFQKPVMAEIEDTKALGGHVTGFEQYGKLYDQNWNQYPAGTKKFFSQMASRTTQQNTFEKIPQPDGSIALVPVTKTSTTTRGGPVPPGRPGGAPPPPTAAVPGETTVAKPNFGPQSRKDSSPQSNAAAAMGLPQGARIVGGKVPPGVAKAYEAYNGSVTRFKVMQDALPQALKGNQQAMINLLYNHIGMTTGLQKGGRITQPIIDEAQNSAPWMATLLKRIGIDNEFEIDPTMLRGVVLDSATMHNMIELAQDRVNQEYGAWQREISAAKGGYGMQQGGLQPPPAPTGSTGGSVHFTEGNDSWDIPVEKVERFQKAHPNAKQR